MGSDHALLGDGHKGQIGMGTIEGPFDIFKIILGGFRSLNPQVIEGVETGWIRRGKPEGLLG